MEEKINWGKYSQAHWKGVIDKQKVFITDEIGDFDFKLHKNKEQSCINLHIFTDEEE